MTLLAGVFRRSGPILQTAAELAALEAQVSRDPSDAHTGFRGPDVLLVQVDIGGFGTPARLEEASSITLVAGEPLIVQSGAEAPKRDIMAIAAAASLDQFDALRKARGVFAFAHYDSVRHQLTIGSDKLGIRPLYWWSDGDTVVFSSTLRLLESLPWITKDVDLRGLAELVAFGFPMGQRSPYRNIQRLHAAQVLQFSAEIVTSTEYWRWQDVTRSTADLAQLQEASHGAFVEAIRLRQRSDRYATAFLSGGMDSRCVVAALRSSGVDVHSFNFGRHGTQDKAFGAELALRAETVHEEIALPDTDEVKWSQLIADARDRSTQSIRLQVERPHLVWSGDGGSVCVGHVYIRPAIVDRCLSGDLSGAADAYVAAEHAMVPRRILTKSVVREMVAAPKAGVLEELERLRTDDLVQSFYLMLLHNDQRRHLHRHFEDIDIHRIELQLPFFDSEFLAVICSIPIELRLYHHFYNGWLSQFPAYVAETYWQAYPGHEPCPVPRHLDLAYQWDSSGLAATRARMRRRSLRTALATTLRPGFPGALMRRRPLAIATLVQAVGLRDMNHLIRAAHTIRQHCQ